MAFTETPQAVTLISIAVNPGLERGQGIGSRFMRQAKLYCERQGKQLIAHNVSAAKDFYDQLGFMDYLPARQFAADQYVYDPQPGLSIQSAVHCPTCGDPLKGQYGTFCPRCQWSEMDANLDSDPLSNPPDPTVDMHRGIQARTAGKLEDFLMNPKSRPDLQTPEGQRWLAMLRAWYRTIGDKFDPLTPWLTREWKKGRVHHHLDEGSGPLHIGHPYYERPDGAGGATRIPLSRAELGHWSDFLQSNHPTRRQLGDIMQHDVGSFHDQVNGWDQAMQDEAHEKALQGGQVVHTTPDNWTVRRLTTPEECTAEGEAMGHCVGGYGQSVQRGDTLIYSLRDPKNFPHATTEIQPKYIEWRGQRVPINQLDMNAPVDEGEDVGQPIPEGGQVVQIQGKSNREPIDEHKARLADWFRSFHPEERPTRDNDEDDTLQDDEGYGHYQLDEPGLIPRFEEEYGSLAPAARKEEDDYGLIHTKNPLEADYESLLDKIRFNSYGYYDTPEDKHIQDIYRLASERGEVAELAKALEGYEQEQLENYDQWKDMNYEYAPKYVEEAEPHGWEDEHGEETEEGEGRPFWTPESPDGERVYDPSEAYKAYEQAEQTWLDQHPGMTAASQMYKLINPHFNQQTQTWEKDPIQQPQPPQAPATFSKWFEAVEETL